MFGDDGDNASRTTVPPANAADWGCTAVTTNGAYTSTTALASANNVDGGNAATSTSPSPSPSLDAADINVNGTTYRTVRRPAADAGCAGKSQVMVASDTTAAGTHCTVEEPSARAAHTTAAPCAANPAPCTVTGCTTPAGTAPGDTDATRGCPEYVKVGNASSSVTPSPCHTVKGTATDVVFPEATKPGCAAAATGATHVHVRSSTTRAGTSVAPNSHAMSSSRRNPAPVTVTTTPPSNGATSGAAVAAVGTTVYVTATSSVSSV